MIKVVVSGGFDPLHKGHLRMFEQAKNLGDHLTVILNSDDFLIKKERIQVYVLFRKKRNNLRLIQRRQGSKMLRYRSNGL